MERGGGLENMSDSAGLCLQDLVGGGGGGGGGNNNNNNNNNNGNNNNNASDHLHNHHSLHDSVAAAVSVSSAITGLMTGGSGLSHLHHNSHDVSNHHHHSVVPHTPTLHEPLEKLKRKYPYNYSFPIHLIVDLHNNNIVMSDKSLNYAIRQQYAIIECNFVY